MNRKGFVFVETIVTVVFISFSLLILYQTFNNSMIHERRRLYYDDVVYVYRTYYLKEFIQTVNYAKLVSVLDEDNYIIAIPTSREDVFNYDDNLKGFYELLFRKLDINKLSISRFNFNKIKNCSSYSINNSATECMPLASYSKEEIDYLKTLSSSDNYTGYRFIGSFNIETKEGITSTYTSWVKNAKSYFEET